MAQVAEVRLGRQRAPQYEHGDHLIPYLRSANVVDGGLDLTDVKSMNFEPAEQAIFGLSDGDVLMTEGSGSAETVGTSAVWCGELPGTVCFQNTLLRLRPRSGVTDGRFLAWWARHAHASGQIAAVSSGANIQHIGSDGLKDLKIHVPDLHEQRRIADFLDDRVARIDQIITARRTQIAAVREHWALELEWVLGSISETTRASRVLRVMPGFAFPSEAYSEDPSDRRLLRGVNVAVGSTRWDEVVYWPEDRVDEVGEFVLGAGDLVLGMDRPWIGDGLRIARVTEDDGSPLLLQRVAKLASDVLDSEYLFWAYQSRRFRDQVELDLTGLSVPHLSGDQIGSFDIPVCDAHRQAAVVRALNAGTESVSRLINAIGASIGRLDEYKQSLITAAVTGEIDVTAAGSGIQG